MYTYDEVTTTLLIIIGAIAVFNMLTTAIKGWKELRKPDTDLRETVEEHDRAIKSEKAMVEDHEQRITHLEGCCSDVQGKLANDWQFQQDVGEFHELILLSIKQLLKHGVDGNDKDGLSEMESEIDKYLIKHHK